MDLKTGSVTLLPTGTELATALTFDDVLLVLQHSTVLPTQVDVSTRLTRNIRLPESTKHEGASAVVAESNRRSPRMFRRRSRRSRCPKRLQKEASAEECRPSSSR